jgi:uncharacterized protein
MGAPEETREKLACLRARLASLKGCVVAFSGGVDSTFLLAEAVRALGDKTLAVTARGPLYPDRETEEAGELAIRLGARHRWVEVDPFAVPGLEDNPSERCYFCKRLVFATLLDVAREEGAEAVLDGSNADDLGQHRPGRRAVGELGVESPLEACGFSKEEIRDLSRRMGLPTWDKPPMACLATRFPYGTRLTHENLRAVDRAEEALRELGLRVVRLRCHGDVARIEVAAGEIERVAGPLRDEAARIVRGAGFAYAALDLTGYRSGAMDETLGESHTQRTGGRT